MSQITHPARTFFQQHCLRLDTAAEHSLHLFKFGATLGAVSQSLKTLSQCLPSMTCK